MTSIKSVQFSQIMPSPEIMPSPVIHGPQQFRIGQRTRHSLMRAVLPGAACFIDKC